MSLAKTYLVDRGFDEETIECWQLGYVYEPLPGHERFKGYLSIPYLTKAGTVAIKFRCIQCLTCEGHPKYDSEAGAGTYLFGSLSFWVDSPFICVTEGELDAIACGMAGLPAVGISGASKWQKHWAYCFEGYEEVIVLADGDKPGEKLASNVSNSVHTSRVVTFPQGSDVNAYLVEHGADALRRFVLGR